MQPGDEVMVDVDEPSGDTNEKPKKVKDKADTSSVLSDIGFKIGSGATVVNVSLDGYSRPDYPETTIKRIISARVNAVNGVGHNGVHVWYLGKAPNGGLTFMMRSFKPVPSEEDGEIPVYHIHAYHHPLNGGYVHSLGLAPLMWITCTCEAFAQHQMPCKHAGAIQLRLEREVQSAQ